MEIINNNKENIINIDNKEETTFNKLQVIQTLLKKESALRGLYLSTGINTQKDIENLCKEIYEKKIEVLNVLKNSSNSINIVNYQFIENNKEYLKDLYLYIPKLLDYLWQNPSIIAKLLINSDINDVISYIAPLICNDFYENLLSPNYIEEQLIYIIYILLENEIEKLKDVNETNLFLNNTPCGYFLSELIYKKDIKAFFNIILKDVIEVMELSNNNKILFEAIRIEKNINENMKKKLVKSNTLSKSSMIKENDNTLIESQKLRSDEEQKQHEIFFTKYVIDLSLQKLNELKNKYILENNNLMKNFIDFQLNGQDNNEIYSNKQFFKTMNKNTLYSPEILMDYERSFFKVIKFIDSLLDTILENIDFLPYSIRCICKMISFLLDKKFKNINMIEKYRFISKFFLHKIFIPILLNPANNALINNYIISNNTLFNLNEISLILIQFSSFKLYNIKENGGFTPFNHFFLDSMEKLMKIYDHLIKVKLPTFIGKLINGEILKNNYEYNYFDENKNEILFHRSIFLSANHIKVLLNNITKLKEIIYNEKNDFFQKIVSKMTDNKGNSDFLSLLCKENDLIIKKPENQNKSKEKVKETKERNIKYFLISDFFYNDKNKKIFSVERGSSHFKLEEKKISKNKKENIDNINVNKDNKEIIENIIIKTKNIISTLLYNYRMLIETDFEEREVNNTLDIFKKLRIYMKSTDFVVDERIPSEWYMELLFEYLRKLPPEYRKDDYKKLYEELKNDIEKCIKQYDFEELSLMIDKKKFGKKIKSYYNNKKEILDDINLNQEVNDIIEKSQINVKLYFKYNKEIKELTIYKEDKGDKQLDFLDSFIFVDNKEKPKTCSTIESFTKNFPDLNKYITDPNTQNIFVLQKKLNVPGNLSNFFNIIEDYLKSKIMVKDEKSLKVIYEKIYDYVMSKIYHKLYPNVPDPLDMNLYKKTQILSWIEPNNIIKDNYNYNFELVLPKITKYFHFIDIEKSPRKKIINLNNIFNSINSLLTFSQNQALIGVDNQMPILNYILIKAKPKGMFTNYEFMKLYMEEKITKKEGNYLIQLKGILDFTLKIEASNLYNISKEEFEENCKIDNIEDK